MSAAIIAMTPKFVDKIYTEQVKEAIQESYELKPFTIGQEEELDQYAD
ncbi:hypothetical protein [Aerococcus kribbianus]|uniref:Uncharacterized protein n=1 Tax=Aerococcus kribbianus TaxID=2999064 RepID=A0A9X3JGZ5_9LACT|nr:MULTISPECIES: hypothetical protein [unclassified Aerococcus]MCZ0717802.1 hypothetical protein [Aerococcus sp. YH-aer221]MCZ0726089.1 hypothetical protein [Aerococcus sp. YH-aer222]